MYIYIPASVMMGHQTSISTGTACMILISFLDHIYTLIIIILLQTHIVNCQLHVYSILIISLVLIP